MMNFYKTTYEVFNNGVFVGMPMCTSGLSEDTDWYIKPRTIEVTWNNLSKIFVNCAPVLPFWIKRTNKGRVIVWYSGAYKMKPIKEWKIKDLKLSIKIDSFTIEPTLDMLKHEKAEDVAQYFKDKNFQAGVNFTN